MALSLPGSRRVYQRCFSMILLLALSSAGARASDLSALSDETLENAEIAARENSRKLEFLEQRNMIGVEFIVAGSYAGRIESTLGHALIRFVDDDADPLNDLVVGYEMRVVNPSRTFENAAQGGAAAAPVVRSFAGFLAQYMNGEGRSYQRLVLPSSPEIRARLVKNILRTDRLPHLVGDYSLASNNCMSVLLEVLRSVGYHIEPAYLDVPTLAEARFRRAFISPFPALEMRSGADTLAPFVSDRSLWVRWLPGVNREAQVNTTALWAAVDEMTPEQVETLYHQWPARLASMRPHAAEVYKRKVTSPRPLGEAFGLKLLPPALYRICSPEDRTCREERARAALTVWREGDLRAFGQRQRQIYRWEYQRAEQLVPAKQAELFRAWSAPVVRDTLGFGTDLDGLAR